MYRIKMGVKVMELEGRPWTGLIRLRIRVGGGLL
jgi:hypothetical protein